MRGVELVAPVSVWLAAAVALAISSAGCGLTLRSDIHDPDPAAMIPALVDAGQNPTPEQLTAMVDALDHDDAAVRMFAIESLKRATGETRGFRPYDAPDERDLAYKLWRAWLDEREGGATANGPVRTAERRADEATEEEGTHGGGR